MTDDLPRCVVADPPWRPSLHANTRGRKEGPYRAGPQRYYDLMTVNEIATMAPDTARKAHLWLWAINQHIDWAVLVCRAWGFEPQQMITWVKPGLGTGRFQCNTEQIIVARKGGPVENCFGPTGGTHHSWKRRRHSEKPHEFYLLVERVSPGPYLEMFARCHRAGWIYHGNEILP